MRIRVVVEITTSPRRPTTEQQLKRRRQRQHLWSLLKLLLTLLTAPHVLGFVKEQLDPPQHFPGDHPFASAHLTTHDA
jgi:hypothetical protein